MDGYTATLKGHRESFINLLRESTFLVVLFTTAIILVTTRIITAISSSSQTGSKTPPLAPYWVPQFGHIPRIAYNASSALWRLRNRYQGGVFSIRLLDNIHTFISRPSLSTLLLQQPQSVADERAIVRYLMLSSFGLRKQDVSAYNKVFKDIQEVNERALSGSGLEDLTNTTARQLKQVLADLVSFNTYPVDQMEWERLADSDVLEETEDSEPTMEVDFIELIRNFVAKTSTVAIFGTDFIDNFSETWQSLWLLEDGFIPLALKTPIWFPWAKAQRAKNALRTLHNFMYEFEAALDKDMKGEDPGPQWQDLDNVSALVKARAKIFQNHEVPIDARAAFDVALLWSLNAHSSHLISWSLLEIYQDSVLLEQIRDEIAPFVKILQPDNDFGGAVWVPPRTENLDLDGLMTKCPLLKAAYIETLRLYGGGWSVRLLREDLVLGDDGKTGESYVLRKGTYAHIAHDLLHSDPDSFHDPADWQLTRHIRETVDEAGVTHSTTSMGSVETYNGGLTMVNDSALALRKFLLYTAVIISLYEIEPAKGGRWKLPKVTKGPVSSRPSKEVKVWVKRRQLAERESFFKEAF
ncbi:hypothetical protein G7046_g5307 [Stylonectria norvegica]|nr:hypothetical protein G7046_g5307 [Stylonectria norvegica]